MQTEVKTRPELEVYPEMPPVARELQLTRDFLASHDWCQGVANDRKGGYCVIGAYDALGEMNHLGSWVYYMQLATNVGSQPIDGWNDAPDRTKAEVLAALDRAVALALAAGE